MDELITTILHRPYVFAFLLAYLFLSVKRWGWKTSLLWLASGYIIAWISEYASIHVNFPYGEYHYIYENLQGELLVGGVPFFDSLSYPFLIFAGYTTAEFITRRTSYAVFLGALLTMLLDVIIDPIATMGDRWFLGKIHFYAHPGWYFGVPLTNFGGWFLVPLAVIAFNVFLSSRLADTHSKNTKTGTIHGPAYEWLYPAFYISIALFNIAVTFWVGEWKLGTSSSVILCAITAAIMLASRSAPARRMTGS